MWHPFLSLSPVDNEEQRTQGCRGWGGVAWFWSLGMMSISISDVFTQQIVQMLITGKRCLAKSASHRSQHVCESKDSDQW
jgi:hypothetical protein